MSQSDVLVSTLPEKTMKIQNKQIYSEVQKRFTNFRFSWKYLVQVKCGVRIPRQRSTFSVAIPFYDGFAELLQEEAKAVCIDITQDIAIFYTEKIDCFRKEWLRFVTVCSALRASEHCVKFVMKVALPQDSDSLEYFWIVKKFLMEVDCCSVKSGLKCVSVLRAVRGRLILYAYCFAFWIVYEDCF